MKPHNDVFCQSNYSSCGMTHVPRRKPRVKFTGHWESLNRLTPCSSKRFDTRRLTETWSQCPVTSQCWHFKRSSFELDLLLANGEMCFFLEILCRRTALLPFWHFLFVLFCRLDYIYGLGGWEGTRFCSGPNVHTKVSCLEGFVSLQILRTSSEFFCIIYCIRSLSVSVADFYTILYLAYARNIYSTSGSFGWKKKQTIMKAH